MRNGLNDNRIKPGENLEELKIGQLQIEISTWKRFLNFFRDENVCLKNRLSDILMTGFEKMLLEELENFQTKFIKHDEAINLLRNDLAELDKLLSNQKPGNQINGNTLIRKLDHFRNNIINSEKQFGQLQLKFNTYLAENI
jgi:hypothetical protein